MAERSRRLRMVYMQVNEILGLFNWKDHEHLSLPVLDGLPDGYVVRNVGYDYGKDALAIAIEHPSFDEVSLGSEIPAFCNSWSVRRETVTLPKAIDPIAEVGSFDRAFSGVLDEVGRSLCKSMAENEDRIAREIIEDSINAGIGGNPIEPAKKSWEFLGAP